MLTTKLDQDQFENTSRWEAHLNNGLIVYSDGLLIDDKSDWERLLEYCKENDIKAKNFCIAFRDQKIFMKENERYYFRRMYLGDFSGFGKDYFIVGCGQPGEITVYKYMLPELTVGEFENRIVLEEDLL